MGNEALCRVEVGDERGEAKVLLETEELIVRGAIRAKIPFRQTQNVRADGDVLRLRWNDKDVRLHVGAAEAKKWAEKIRNPKSVIDKLGIKAKQKISLVGSFDDAFLAQLEAKEADVSKKLRAASDVIFLAAAKREELEKLARLRESLAPAGAIWVIRPKGVAAITEAEVMAAGKAAGLVDVKVVKFSDTHTAEKFVIPVSKR